MSLSFSMPRDGWHWGKSHIMISGSITRPCKGCSWRRGNTFGRRQERRRFFGCAGGSCPFGVCAGLEAGFFYAEKGAKLGFCLRYMLALACAVFFTLGRRIRPDSLGTVFLLLGIVIWRLGRRSQSATLAGALFALSAMSNLRMAALSAVTLGLLLFIQPSVRRWHWSRKSRNLLLGAAIPCAILVLCLVWTGSFKDAWNYLYVQNSDFNKSLLKQNGRSSFLYILMLPFQEGDWAGGFLLLSAIATSLLGFTRFKRPDVFAIFSILQCVQLLSLSSMGVHYLYHLQGILLIAGLQTAFWIGKTGIGLLRPYFAEPFALALLVLFFVKAVFTLTDGNFNGILKTQDAYMERLDQITSLESSVLDGVGFALRREPAYHFWFLPAIARFLALHRNGPQYTSANLLDKPPGVIVGSGRLQAWLQEWPGLQDAVVHHYLPETPFLLRLAMSARLSGNGAGAHWRVPCSGTFCIVSSQDLAKHLWFEKPLDFFLLRGPRRTPLTIDPVAMPVPKGLTFKVDGIVRNIHDGVLALNQGQELEVIVEGSQTLGIFILPANKGSYFLGVPASAVLDMPLYSFSWRSD
jgi:hypothetical protein